jgi:hypothetical protein
MGCRLYSRGGKKVSMAAKEIGMTVDAGPQGLKLMSDLSENVRKHLRNQGILTKI